MILVRIWTTEFKQFVFYRYLKNSFVFNGIPVPGGGGGAGVLPYMGYIGVCRCEAVYSSKGYINQSERLGLE